ncbi:Predicted dithiol-disulfide isomerase, DsbA family [Halobacillus dabanensis]|uniref:Predicted dithiol-disulfide isomerase, DsbA family n=1 Tax=Halobacillus dabanensis TaxID=240302 RepID=A0A1I3XC52_HALDA|nr:DsbA family oxidoreductase [Halobacillus dabanensis]SFK16919.1 Predicted dithiol-disulfide isomerase, DsbA family [Halobacillus dabanensis]
MKIEVWSDFVCPFCYIGKRRLEEALAKFPDRQVEVVYKSFELDPQAERNTGRNMHEKLAAKYGRSIDEAREMTQNMTEQAKMVGLDFHFDTVVPTNTFDAHRVSQLANEKGLGKAFAEHFFQAVLTDGKDIGDHETISSLATEVGLDREEVNAVLTGTDYTDAVRREEAEAQQIGVQGVPFFVINRKYAVSGAQPTDVFVQGLEKAFAEEEQKPVFEDLSSEGGAACTEDGCEVPQKDN